MSYRSLTLTVALLATCLASPLRAQEATAPLQPYAVKPDQIPKAALEEAEKKFECRAEIMKQGVTAFRISAEMAVWQIPCDLFAYNASSVFVLVPVAQPDKFKFLDFQAPPGRTREDPYVLINPEWNARAHTVASFAKGRGLGDCGTYEVHKLVDGRFQLMEFREKENCDGKPTPPAQYKLVYRAR